MSRNMQLTVRVNPYYKNDFEAAYPRLARALRHHDPAYADKNPSLYELAGQLEQLLYRFDGTPLRPVLLRHKDTLRNLYEKTRDNIAEWNLARADSLLYGIEDIFDEIESELA